MGQTQQTNTDEEIDIKALQDMYKKFVTECPSGLLFLHEFKRFFGVDPTGEAAEFVENMFRAFDKNGVSLGPAHGDSSAQMCRSHPTFRFRTTPSTSWSLWRR